MDVDEFISTYPPEVASLGNAARIFLLDRFPSLIEEPDIPSRIIVYRITPGNEGVVFTLIPARRGVKLGIYRGRSLPDTAGLLGGSGKVHATISLAHDTLNFLPFHDLVDAAMQQALQRTQSR